MMSAEDALRTIRRQAAALAARRYDDAALVDDAADVVEQLIDVVVEYSEHQSWRCEHPPHWYLVDRSAVPEGDCPCGLTGTLARLDLAREAQGTPASDAS